LSSNVKGSTLDLECLGSDGGYSSSGEGQWLAKTAGSLVGQGEAGGEEQQDQRPKTQVQLNEGALEAMEKQKLEEQASALGLILIPAQNGFLPSNRDSSSETSS
jgi:hypothetical protein